MYFTSNKLDNLTDCLDGVTVTCEPKELNVPLAVPLDSFDLQTHHWTVCLQYNVRGNVQVDSFLYKGRKLLNIGKATNNVKLLQPLPSWIGR